MKLLSLLVWFCHVLGGHDHAGLILIQLGIWYVLGYPNEANPCCKFIFTVSLAHCSAGLFSVEVALTAGFLL